MNWWIPYEQIRAFYQEPLSRLWLLILFHWKNKIGWERTSESDRDTPSSHSVNFHPGSQPMDSAEDRGEYRSTSNANHRGSYRRWECYKQGVGEGGRISKVQNFWCRQGWLVFWSIQWLVWRRPSRRLPERVYLEGTFSLLKKKKGLRNRRKRIRSFRYTSCSPFMIPTFSPVVACVAGR